MLKRYVADFETINNPEDCRVWCYSITEIGNKENTHVGLDIDDFMKHIKTLGSCEIFFHNLAFDGQFLLYNWLTNGYTHTEEQKLNTNEFTTLISDDGAFYSMKIKLDRYTTITFYDSLKKIPFPVSTISKAFDIEELKGEIDYNKERPVGYELDENEINYVKNDTIIVAEALNHQFNEGLEKMTIASDALSSFKKLSEFDKLFPILPDNEDSFCRLSYRGGWVYVNPKYQAKTLENLQVFDVNSLYPSRMYDCPLPYDKPIYFSGEYVYDKMYPLYIIKIRVSFKLKDNALPTIQIKKNPYFIGTEYITEQTDYPVELVLTSVDFELFKDMYHIYYIEYVEGMKFKSVTGIFKSYIDHWNKVKMDNSGEGGSNALRTIAKLMLNSLYGKFASRTHVKKKIPFLKDDGVVGYKTSDEEIKDSIYTPIASFITAYARDKTIRSAYNFMQGTHKCKDGINDITNDKDYFCYADTDSLHILHHKDYEALLDVDDKALGLWKLESKPDKARFLRAKTYIEVENGKQDIKCAGMPKAVKEMITFDEFVYGYTELEHKLKPTKVKGGVILTSTPFTIKEPKTISKNKNK